MRRWIAGAVATGALLVGSWALAQSVNVDFDSKASFAGYRTYAWIGGTPSPNPLGEQRIHAAVDQQLAAKGFSQVTANPDVYVCTHVVTHEEKELTATGFGGGWGFGGMATAQVNTYVKGTLAVDLYDAKTRQMVWRGVGTGTASDRADKNTSKVNKALDKMFKQYPPGPKNSTR